MKILHARDENTAQPIENTFIAVEGRDTEVGRCTVTSQMLPKLFPDHPHIIDIEVTGREDALDALYGAGVARAQLAAMMEKQGAIIRTKGTNALRERLHPLGFRETDAEVRLERTHRRGPVIKQLPVRCTIVFDTLDDELEARYFIERYNEIYSTDTGREYLREVRSKQGFSRTVMAAPDGLAGEMLAWVEDGVGIIGYIYTSPRFRRRGVADYLLDLARKYFLDAGIEVSRIDIWTRMRAAHAMASNAGFRVAETLKRYLTIDINREDMIL